MQSTWYLIWYMVFVVQLLSHVWLFATPWTAVWQASLSFTISQSLLKLMSIELVMPSNHLVLCCPSSCPQSFPASGSFPMSWLFVSGGQSYVIRWIYNLLTNSEQLSCLQMLKTTSFSQWFVLLLLSYLKILHILISISEFSDWSVCSCASCLIAKSCLILLWPHGL